jgi:Ca2+/H+ antiporter
VSRVAAIALIAVSISHVTLICQMHSDWTSKADGLRKLLQGGGERTTKNPQAHRAAWIALKTKQPPALIDNALNTGILLASCVVTFCACFYLADSVSSERAADWLSRPVIGYIIVPLVIGFTQHAAAWLHTYTHVKENNLGQSMRTWVGESMCASVASSIFIASLVLPVCVIAGWITGSTDSVSILDTFQAWFLTVSVLISILALHHGNDDWYKSAPIVR